MKNRKYLFFLRKKLFKIISCILSILFLLAFPVSAETISTDNFSLSLADCYIFNPSSGSSDYRPLVYNTSDSADRVVFQSTQWVTNVSGTTENISISAGTEFVLRFVFTFSPEFQPDGNIVNSFDLLFRPVYSTINATIDFTGGTNFGELRTYVSNSDEGVVEVISTIYPSVTNTRQWNFYSPESRPNTAISHYVVDLYCIAPSRNLTNLYFYIFGDVISGGPGPNFPSYVPPDGSTIDNYNQIEGDLIGSVTDNASASRDEVESSLNNTVTTYGGAFAAVGRFISDIVYIPKINGLVYFSLGIAVVPLIVGMTINGLRSHDRQVSRSRFGQRKD